MSYSNEKKKQDKPYQNAETHNHTNTNKHWKLGVNGREKEKNEIKANNN